MNDEVLSAEEIDSEKMSQEFERDARRYNRAFTEEEEVRLQ